MKKYLVIIPVLFLVYLITLNFNDAILDGDSDLLLSEDKNPSEIIKNVNAVAVSYNGQNLNMPIDDYVIGVLSCEMPALFNVEALRAGAVAARTFYLYKEQYNPSYIATTTDQCFITEDDMQSKWGENFSKYYNIIKEAVEDTSGEYISYKGDVIEAFYFSMSNGYTETCENVFSESKPYLVSTDSLWDKDVSNFEKTVSFSIDEFLSKLSLTGNTVDVSDVLRSESGRVNTIKINGVIFKGTELRKKLGIRSTDFDIVVVGKSVNVTTRGYGHGVGLSQYGANEMAKLGYSYKDIIKHYYTGVEISTL